MRNRAHISAALLSQNARLRSSITKEFAAMPTTTEYPKYTTAMHEYRRELLLALDANDATLRTIFGEPDHSLLGRMQQTWREFFGGDGVYDNLGSLWRHCAKDWSRAGDGGVGGQSMLRAAIVDAVVAECARVPAEALPARVCIPGSGQARLAFDVACGLEGRAHVTGFESSEPTLGFARWMIERAARPNELTIHPWLDAFSNNWDVQSRAAKVSVPDIVPTSYAATRGAAAAALTLRHGDFLRSTSDDENQQQYHVVISSFFMDCVDDLPAATTAVRDALLPGGLWVCAGPLHFYQGGEYVPRPSPALEHVLALAADVGLEIEDAPRRIHAPYPQRPGALISEADWSVPLFTCRRTSRPNLE